MPQLDTVFTRARQISLSAIRSLANTHSDAASSLAPTALDMLTFQTPAHPTHAPIRQAGIRT
ncbi:MULTISPECIES: hypothetical protein [unclassified Pseudomonas]|uniref:hypothetical protein n=1 Tax=unclassified Pseudomonas TaxID=196821 RepID=UPI0009605B4E|nr:MULTISPECIES: hypothetical protein [unclassified Pseudomonas]OLU12164.1 hypothetical protein BVH01_24000 [Pseudomonas sp. PA1(2017)]OLU26758.1 hypothetical protein BVH06_18925 [Pseudomonas sp. PA27(2017)]